MQGKENGRLSHLEGWGVRAAQLTLTGDEPRFEMRELPDPVPRAGEVVVELVTAALNRRDWWLWRSPDTPTPVTLGSDGAGRVARWARAWVTSRPGTRS